MISAVQAEGTDVDFSSSGWGQEWVSAEQEGISAIQLQRSAGNQLIWLRAGS